MSFKRSELFFLLNEESLKVNNRKIKLTNFTNMQPAISVVAQPTLSSSLIIANPAYTAPEFGFYNNGSICWWNSLLQMFLSLPAFNELMLELSDNFEEHFKNNKLAADYINFIYEFMPLGSKPINASKYLTYSQSLMSSFMREINIAKITLDYNSQEGVSNGFCVFLEILNVPRISHLFNNKYSRIITCTNCKADVSIDIGKSPLLNFVGHTIVKNNNLSVEDQTNQWINYIKNHSTTVDTYTCDKCRTTMKNVRRVETLKMLRENIVCALDCYSVTGKQTQWYPNELKFMSTNGKYLRYKLVAQIEHSGGYSPVMHTSSGHYWARCLRVNPGQQKTEWKCINDSSVSAANYQPLPSTHLIAYTLVSDT